MKYKPSKIKLYTILILASIFITANTFIEDTTEKDTFISIFDGKSLDGWEAMPAKTAPGWTVKDGILVGEWHKGRSHLTYKNKEIADFEIELKYRFPDKGNSGVSIRAREDETHKRDFQSYHADLGHVGIGKEVLGAWDFQTPGRKEHACFRGDRLVIDKNDHPKLTKVQDAITIEDINKGDWNTARIVAKGNNFKFYINGKIASEFTEYLPSEKRLDKGMIQLQVHDPNMIVHFKDIRLKVLK